MAETQKEKEERLRREAAAQSSSKNVPDPNAGAVKSIPEEKTPRTETKPTGGTTSTADWEKIQHPGQVPRTTDPYGTRPVSELTPPTTVTDKADLAAVRMMEKGKTSEMDRERIMTEATPEAAAARAAMTSKEAEAERRKTGAAMTGATMAAGAATTPTETEAERERRMKAGAAMTGAAVATGAAASRTSPEAGERTTRQGAAIGTEPTTTTTTRPVTGVVVPPGTERVTPMKPYGTVNERARMHAEDPSIHPDWETQPQINAPQDVGVPTAEGQADAARLRAGERRSDVAKEPRIDRRGGEYEVPAASGARAGGVTGAAKEVARDVKETGREIKEETKKTASDVKQDVDRKV